MNNPERSDAQPAEGDKAIDASDLIRRLQQGELTEADQVRLGEFLESGPPGETKTIAQTRKELFSGPLPPPELLNRYDDESRSVILQMAQKEQTHTHEMLSKRLQGAIRKDRRGQWIGGAIAITGLLVAAYIVPHSVVAATILGAIDLFGMVALFVAPRILEGRSKAADDGANEQTQ